MSRFIKLPIEALMDDRLSDRDRRVLMALYSFGANPGDTVWPSREAISGLARCPAPHVSTSISRLVGFGWIERKQGSQGPNQYRLLCPTVTDSVSPQLPNQLPTVTELVTVTESVTGSTVTESVSHSYQIGNPTVTESVTRRTDQEQTTEQTNIDDVRARAEEDKQPGGTSSGGEGPHDGDSAQRKPRKHVCRFAIPRDWEPDQSFWTDIDRLGIERGFVVSLIPEFRLYWHERGEQRPGWERSFLSHVQRNWMREQERHSAALSVTRAAAGGQGPGGRQTFDDLKLAKTREAMQAFVNDDLSEGVVYEAQ